MNSTEITGKVWKQGSNYVISPDREYLGILKELHGRKLLIVLRPVGGLPKIIKEESPNE